MDLDTHRKPTAAFNLNCPTEHKLSVYLFLLITAYQPSLTPTRRQHGMYTIRGLAHINFFPAAMTTRLISEIKQQTADLNNAERQTCNT